MNLSTKQKETHGHEAQTCSCQEGGEGEWDGLGVWGQQMQTITYRMNKQQGPTLQNRELYLISWDRTLFFNNKEYIYIYICMYVYV